MHPRSLRLTRRLAVVAVVVVALIFASSAAAQTSQQGYSTPGGNTQAEIQSGAQGNNAAQTVNRTNTGNLLPFTGLDLGFVLAVGGGLLLVGFGLRRMTRHEDLSA